MSDYDEKAEMNSGSENENTEELTYIDKYSKGEEGSYNDTFSTISIYEENFSSLLDDYVNGYTNDLWIVIDQRQISARHEFVVNYECFLELFKHLDAIGVDSSSAKGFALDYYLYSDSQFQFYENGRMMMHIKNIYGIQEYAESIKDMLAGIGNNYDVLKSILESDINRKLFSSTGKHLTDLLIELYQFFEYIDAVIVGSIKSLTHSRPEVAKFAMDKTHFSVMYGPKRREYDEKCKAKREYDESFEGRMNNKLNSISEKANKFFGKFKK